MDLAVSTHRIVAWTAVLALASLGPLAGCKKSPEAKSEGGGKGEGKSEDEPNGDKPAELGKNLGAGVAEGDPAAAKATEPAEATDSWFAFSSTEGRFSARFPSAPESQTLPTPTVLGNVDQKMFSTTLEAAFFAASFADYPADAVSTAVPADVLDGARNGAVENVNGKLISEEKISIGGYPGRSIRIEATPEGIAVVVQAQIYLVKNRLYQMIVVRPGGMGSEADVSKFFASFRLTE